MYQVRLFAVGRIVRLAHPTKMTNGLTAVPGHDYEIRAAYPGGSIVKSIDESAPGGLVPPTTPVYEPGEEQMSNSIDSIEEVATRVAAEEVVNLPGVDYLVDPLKKPSGTGSMAKIATLLVESGKVAFGDAEVRKLLENTEDVRRKIGTKQEPYRVFVYYRKDYIKCGFIRVAK